MFTIHKKNLKGKNAINMIKNRINLCNVQLFIDKQQKSLCLTCKLLTLEDKCI